MSDGAVKLDEEGSPTDGLKRAGRARICKQCRFTTTDVREFSNHRLHAHAEENAEEKNQTRKGSLRRKSSAVSVVSEDQIKEELCETKNKPDKKEQDNPETKDICKKEPETEQTMASEQISDELLNTLALAPRKNLDSSDKLKPVKMEVDFSVDNDEPKRPTLEKIVLEKMNGHKEEVVLVNRDDDIDDEPRLVIADDTENGSDNLELSGDPSSLCRSGNIQNRTYLCSACDFGTTNAKAYLHHQKDVHTSDITIYECDICDYATKYKQKLPRHRKLHFTGKDGYNESDLDSSLTERELKEMRDNASINYDIINGDEELDDDIEMEDDEEELMSEAPDTSITNTPGGSAPVQKKKRIRQEVDPLKYYEVVDEVGVKYACSKCGNVYKWRKSLNKHWKEKHFGEVPDLTKPPSTLQNYTLFSRFKAKIGGQPPPPAAPNVVYGAAVPSPTNQVKQNRSTPTSSKTEEETVASHLSNVVMPRQIGPFIAGTTNQSVLNALKAQMRTPENHHELRQMIELQKRAEANRSTPKSSQMYNSQSEPLDFSKPLDFSRKTDIKQEVMDSETDSLQEMPVSLVKLPMKDEQKDGTDQDNPVLQCNKCTFIAKTLVDYSAHMSLHQNKRAFKCAECQSHFNGVEDLNRHFLEAHAEKIQEHKEAIQKIPHGLQQTYHLLKMPLENISSFSSQELTSSEPKQLKCSMCQFVAKWPAELQKHAVSHSEERPFVCMVCGSTYKWKWDLVKHFEKSHSTLPNPYKRRDGGMNPTSVNSPSTPPLETISKTASALMDASMTGASYILNEEIQPSKKRRLSETDIMDSEEYYHDLLDRQVRKKREMLNSQNSQSPLTVEGMWCHKRPSSEPTWSSSGELDSEEERQRQEERSLAGFGDFSTPKRDITEALKQRINSMKQSSDDERKTPAKDGSKGGAKGSEVVLPYKCSVCDYRARWPSEISQHMKNHSNEKPFHCPRCSYKSKWKWDVVKHLRRCGGGTVHDVIDTTKLKKMAPPNVMVLPQSTLQQSQLPKQILVQSQKQFLSQPVFPGSQISPSMANASMNNSRISTPNFSVSVGGQDHPDSLDLSQTSVAQQQSSSVSKQQPVFRSVVNQGMYHCLECPFVGNTQAELRRHSVLHSENKPFMCNMCGYSSRWKCDLKKHKKIYGHFSAGLEGSDGDGDGDNSQEKYVELDDESDEENKSTLYMCPQCPYNSYKRQAYDLHLSIHGNLLSDPQGVAFPEKSTSAKYKCTKCDYQGNDLSSFLQHKRTHQDNEVSPKQQSSEPERVSPVPNPSEVSNRTLHLKHRRKPVKQFRCNKCPYICFRRVALTNHELMHSSRGADAYLCMFCDYNVFSKSLLLQHMRLHPEYHPAECSDFDIRVSPTELMEMEELEEKEINGEERNDASVVEENNNIGDYESGFQSRVLNKSISPYGGRMTSPGESKEKKPVTNNNTTPTNNNITNNNTKSSGLPCEWCSATFPNVVTLYQHAQTLHPTQLKAQEAGDLAASQAPSKSSQLEQIVRERQREYQVYHQFMAQQQQQLQSRMQVQTQNPTRRYVPLAPKPHQQLAPQASPSRLSSSSTLDMVKIQGHDNLNCNQLAALRARKSTSQQRRSRSFQCTKCSFTAPNAITYLRHIERHGSNCKHTCLYCDYSIDRLNLLYQHMKGTHAGKWQGTIAEKINLSVHAEDSNNNIIDGLNQEEHFSLEELNASSSSSYNDSFESEIDFRVQYEEGALALYSSKGVKPVLIILEESSWRGTNLEICSLDGRKHYKCPKCLYISSNAANCSLHIQHHIANRKYKCDQCTYSADSLKHIQTHMESIHTEEPNFILKSAAELSSQKSEFVAENELTNSNNETMLKSKDDRQSSPVISCPKCPFKTGEGEKFQVHINRHQYKGKYECQLCDYSVDKYKYLRHHALLHTTKKQLMVDMDDQEERALDEHSTNGSDMRNPEEENSNDQLRFRCSCCPYVTLRRQDILNHRLNHIQKSSLSCQLCTYSTDQNEQLDGHTELHQGPSVKAVRGFHDVMMDPYNESYKLIEQLPDDDDEEEMEIDEFGSTENAEYEEMDEMEALADADTVEDDVEIALMEEELRDSVALTGDMKSKNFGRNLNEEGAFDGELQFRNYKCPDCPYSSNSNGEFRKHCRLHGSCFKFQCDYCSYSLDRANLISQHRKLHFQEQGFEVAPLIAKLLNPKHEDYDAMLQKVGKEIAYPPTESSKTGDENSDYSYLFQRGAEGIDEKPRYSCNKCPYKCQALKSFKCHIQLHGLMRKYKCDYCDWSADRLNLLYQHRKVHANEPNFNPAPGDIVFLNREFILDGENVGSGTVGVTMMEYSENPIPSDLSKDSQSVKKSPSGHKVFTCKICPFKTDSVNTYSYHKKLHCLQARYNCSECSYSINNIASLKEHIKLHKKEREMIRSTISESTGSHKCPKCPYSSPNKNLLVSHTAMHSSGRKYECSQCDFSSDKQMLLNFHMKVHDENYSDSNSQEEMELLMKKGPDVIGPQLFLSYTSMKDIDSDSNSSSDLEQKCEKCPFSTPSKDELGSHLQHHEMSNKMACMYCTYSCNQEEELLKHIQVHFPTTPVDKELLRVLKRQNQNYKKNMEKTLNNDDSNKEGSGEISTEDHKEPDSTVNESPKDGNKEKEEDISSVQKDAGKTKVYVCQYCEREFDCKVSMLQHEKQHLVGS